MELHLQSFRLSLVLKSFFFPLTSPEVFESLKARGFDTGRPSAQLPAGPRAYVSGIVARKGKVMLEIDQPQKIVAAQGESIEDSIQVLNEIVDMIGQDFNVNVSEELDYVELIAHYLIKSDKNPFEIIQNASEGRFRKRFQEILKTDTSDYRFSIVPRGVLPSSRKWFEISVSPKLTMLKQAYWVEVIFRDTSHTTVANFAANLNSTISMIIATVEESS